MANLSVVYLYVSKSARQGYVLDNSVTELVNLPKGKRAQPGSIIRCSAKRDPERRTEIVSWQEQDDYVLADAIRVRLDGEEVGLVGVADPERWIGDAKDLEIRIKTGEGTIIAVPAARQQELVTHFIFEEIEQERDWIVDRVINDQPVMACSGGTIQFSAHFSDLLGWDADSAFSGERVLADRREELETMAQRRRDLKGELGRLQEQVSENEQKSGSAKAELERVTDEAVRLREETRQLTKSREALAEELRDQDATFNQRRAELEASLREKLEEHDDLTLRLDHLRAQAHSGFVLDEAPSLERTQRLGALQPIDDEMAAIGLLAEALADRAEIRTLVGVHVALKHCPFVVLTGPSGSGKSSLLSLYAQALGMAHEVVAVQPNWTSSADLHGFVSPIGSVRHYVTTPFAEVLGLQYASGDRLYGEGIEAPFLSLVILDEINLAHVEYYLADYLSALETESREVVIASPLELRDALVPLWLRRFRGRVRLPHSMLFAGTANEDHTTQGFSDKFRDRAGVLDIPPRPAEVGAATVSRAGLREPLGRVTPATWRAWKRVPEASPALRNCMASANKVLAAFRTEGFHVGHRIVRDVEVLMRAAHPLLKAHLPRGKEKVVAGAALDLALSLRVGQKYVPLIEKRTGWAAHERREAINRILASVPDDCTLTRGLLEGALS